MGTMNIKEQIFKYNRNPKISGWFETRLDEFISDGTYHADAYSIYSKLIDDLRRYKSQHGISRVFVGISGGIDSALTAALFHNFESKTIGE
jgi:nicotinamide-nucleotide amidase